MDSINVSELVELLGSDEDAVRKMAVFKLQSNIGDPSFADIFILEGGLSKLRNLALHTTGNTLAYSLTSFARLLEVDKGWDYVNQALVERVGDLSALLGDDGSKKLPGGPACCHTPSCQHPPRSHVNSRSRRVTPLHRHKSNTTTPVLRLSRAEASHLHIPSVLGNACEQIVLRGPCSVRELLAADQFVDARSHCW